MRSSPSWRRSIRAHRHLLGGGFLPNLPRASGIDIGANCGTPGKRLGHSHSIVSEHSNTLFPQYVFSQDFRNTVRYTVKKHRLRAIDGERPDSTRAAGNDRTSVAKPPRILLHRTSTIVLAILRWVPIASIPEAVRVLSRKFRGLRESAFHSRSP